MTNNILQQIALSFIDGVGLTSAKNLISYCGGLNQIFTLSQAKLERVPGIGPVTAKAILSKECFIRAEAELRFIEDNDISCSFYLNPSYPEKLKQIPDAPLMLYYRGGLPAPTQRSVAIVGTRLATEAGRIWTENLVAQLKSYDVQIISGLAYGIDTAAHTAAVKYGLPTYGVLGNGLEKIYPNQNKQLAHKMLEQGGLITQFHHDMEPEKAHFPMRNKIVAGLSDALVVVESAAEGGSMITANLANEYYKDVFAFPGRNDDSKSIGCNKLIKEHKANLLESAKDIAYIMGWNEDATRAKQMTLALDLTVPENNVIVLLKNNQNINIDQLHHAAKMPMSELSSMLLNLEFKGIVRSLPGKRYNLVL